MSAHTKGPWTITRDGRVWNISAPNDPCLFGNPQYYPYVSDNYDDALLITAAPELLEAVDALLKAVEGTAGGHLAADILEGTVVGNARAAIAKAKGEA